MLPELYQYVNSNTPSSDADSVRCTLAYFEACNQPFENGFLCHSKVCNIEGDALKSIEQGFAYFVQWYNDLYGLHIILYLFSMNIDMHTIGTCDSTNARFLSWQS